VARWAESESDLREAQRLRYRVFAEEMGARLHPFAGAPAGHDVDRFDACCEHLLVRTVAADGTPGAVVGTYRLLTPSGARRAGGWYSDAEFDLAPLVAWRPRTVELGRSCVDPAWRSGGVILLLWTALCHYMAARGFDAMIGCASMPMDGEGALASAVWHQLKPDQLAPDAWRVVPHSPLRLHANAEGSIVAVPPLIKGYLRCGTKVLGPPAYDPDFHTADLPMMARLVDVPLRLRKPVGWPSRPGCPDGRRTTRGFIASGESPLVDLSG
jgi:putative hemolysin